MTDEQRQRKREANRAYRERQKLKKSPKQPIFESTPNPEAEERWKRVQPGNIQPPSEQQLSEYVDSREKAQAVQAESVAREEYIDLLFSKFERCTNIPQLLQGIIREQIETRIVMTDLLAEILKGVQK